MGTTEHQKCLKIGTNRKKALFLPKGQKKPRQELEVSPRMRRQSVVQLHEFL